MAYVKFTSHRSRDYAARKLGGLGQSYYSFQRDTGYGTYQLTDEQIASIRGAHLIHFTRLRGPYTDLLRCWDGAKTTAPNSVTEDGL